MGHYNEKMLQYAHFVHSLSMLERLLLSKKGRDLFPVKIPGRKGACFVVFYLCRTTRTPRLSVINVPLVFFCVCGCMKGCEISHE